jgi:hypothetical protein
MNTCETGRHLQTSCTNCSQLKVLHALLTVHVNQTSSYGTGPIRATCYVPVGRLEESSEGRWENTGPRVRVSISGRNSGISGAVWSTFAKVDTATQNDLWIHFEGAKAACEQQAGSTAASSFAPALHCSCSKRVLELETLA